MAGVFAASTDITTSTDTLQIVVEATCSFTDGHGGEITGHTYEDTVTNGENADFQVSGSAKSDHTFNVVCNDDDGWKVTAVGSDLEGQVATNDHVIEMVASALDNTSTEGQWNAALSGDAATGDYMPVPTTQTPAPIIATGGTSTAASTFTVTYAAYVGTETAADTYNGDITYQLDVL
ncbi:hypothetical protein IKE72_02010 [Candidatus Saccharibacteria bacterium]|nr:hypothetical protein [Candidatus Saccharibacteria bacterium]